MMPCYMWRERTSCAISWFTLALLLGLADSFGAPPRVSSKHLLHRRPSSCIHSGDTSTEISSKEQLLSYLSQVNVDANRLPCGLQCTDQERAQVSLLVANCCSNSLNRVVSHAGKIAAGDVLGQWELLYTSSRTFGINKSLSGLGRSSSENAKFQSLRQKLTGSKYLGFIEFVERLGSGETALDVVISGEWMLQPERDLDTGAPITAIRADLETVVYGPSTNNAQDWSSLGPVKLLDIIYMDEDLQILRGSVNTDTIFVYQRI